MTKKTKRNDMQGQREVSRRSFVGGAGALAAVGAMGAGLAGSVALAAEGSAAADAKATSHVADAAGVADWDETFDVVVVGSGAAGHAAAIEAARAGASTLLLEKTDIVGGDSMACDGILGGWGTRLAKAQGIELTADETYALFMSHPDWYGPHDPAVARVAADRCGETIDWLEELGVPFEQDVAPRFNYTDLPAIHQVEGKGAAMMTTLAEVAVKEGVDVRTGMPVTQLVTKEGRVTGVVAGSAEAPVRIATTGGVVLATGGYGASAALLVALDPENAGLMPTSASGMTGDGLVMGQAVGAHVTRTAYQPMMYSLGGMGTQTVVTLDYTGRLHGILLDATGNRFCNEGMEFLSREVQRATLRKQNEQGAPVVYLLPTSEATAELTGSPTFDWTPFETPGEAAAALGLDAAAVDATAERYDNFVAAGVDEDFGRPVDDMMPMSGPFYAVAVTVITNVTTGGLKTDAGARVLRLKAPGEEGDALVAIPGLYAAGEVCEWNVAAGWTVCTAATMGRIAGQNAAAGK